jgi:hypothetical protein
MEMARLVSRMQLAINLQSRVDPSLTDSDLDREVAHEGKTRMATLLREALKVQLMSLEMVKMMKMRMHYKISKKCGFPADTLTLGVAGRQMNQNGCP